MIDCQRDLIGPEVKRGIGSAVHNHDAKLQDRASWTADHQAEMDAAIATNHLSSVPVQLRSLTAARFGGRAPHPGRDSFPLGGPRWESPMTDAKRAATETHVDQLPG